MSNIPGNLRNSAEQDKTSTETQLFAEILKRMDAQKSNESYAPVEKVKSINLVELLYFLLSKLHLIALGGLIGALLLGVLGSYMSVPIYTATSKLYIVGQTGTNIIADLQIGSTLTMDYQEVFKTWEVHQMVNDLLGTDYSYAQLQSMLTVANPEDTRVLYISVRHPDAEQAASIANAYAVAAKRFITQTMDSDEPSTFSVALVPSTAAVVSVTSWVIRGILVGTVLVCGILVLIFLLDNRPKSPDDILEAANIPTLAVIPIDSHRKKRIGRKEAAQ